MAEGEMADMRERERGCVCAFDTAISFSFFLFLSLSHFDSQNFFISKEEKKHTTPTPLPLMERTYRDISMSPMMEYLMYPSTERKRRTRSRTTGLAPQPFRLPASPKKRRKSASPKRRKKKKSARK
jgi:hypothetical protein